MRPFMSIDKESYSTYVLLKSETVLQPGRQRPAARSDLLGGAARLIWAAASPSTSLYDSVLCSSLRASWRSSASRFSRLGNLGIVPGFPQRLDQVIHRCLILGINLQGLSALLDCVLILSRLQVELRQHAARRAEGRPQVRRLSWRSASLFENPGVPGSAPFCERTSACR